MFKIEHEFDVLCNKIVEGGSNKEPKFGGEIDIEEHRCKCNKLLRRLSNLQSVIMHSDSGKIETLLR